MTYHATVIKATTASPDWRPETANSAEVALGTPAWRTLPRTRTTVLSKQRMIAVRRRLAWRAFGQP
jgi:hypothetical protein